MGKTIKHLNFCTKIVVTSKKRPLLQISLGFHDFRLLKTNDLEKKQEKKWSAPGICLGFLAEFLPKWTGQTPKNRECPAKSGTYGEPMLSRKILRGPFKAFTQATGWTLLL